MMLFASTAFSQSQENTDDPLNGNLIPEPAMDDYVEGSRAPGILSKPFDVTDANGQLVSALIRALDDGSSGNSDAE